MQDSGEYRRKYVADLYDGFLGRSAPESEIKFHSEALDGGTAEEMLSARFTASDEYFDRL